MELLRNLADQNRRSGLGVRDSGIGAWDSGLVVIAQDRTLSSVRFAGEPSLEIDLHQIAPWLFS
jgi:hypothetical protein